MIEKAIKQHGGNISAIAAQLGITRQTLYNKMKNSDCKLMTRLYSLHILLSLLLLILFSLTGYHLFQIKEYLLTGLSVLGIFTCIAFIFWRIHSVNRKLGYFLMP